jgi:hypothetical protein
MINKEWPKLKRDWTGRLVRLNVTIRNNGGDVFRKGSVMIVNDYYRGLKLSRRRIRNGYLGTVSRVDLYKVDILVRRGNEKARENRRKSERNR